MAKRKNRRKPSDGFYAHALSQAERVLLPQDRGRLVREEKLLVEAGIHSRRRAMEYLGVEDTEAEFNRLREESAGS